MLGIRQYNSHNAWDIFLYQHSTQTWHHYTDHYLATNPEQKDFVIENLWFTLTNTYFVFNEKIYQQKSGTAMGTYITPSYARIAFIPVTLSENISPSLEDTKTNYSLYRKGMKTTAEEWCTYLNSKNWGAHFTLNSSGVEIEYLDLLNGHDEERFIITIIIITLSLTLIKPVAIIKNWEIPYIR